MGVAKSGIFTCKQNKPAGMMKALAYPARIAIVQHLIKANACICGDLVDELGLVQPTISQHLKELKTAGHLSISDVVLIGELPSANRAPASIESPSMPKNPKPKPVGLPAAVFKHLST